MFEGGGGVPWDDDDEEEKTAEKSMEFSNYRAGSEFLRLMTDVTATGFPFRNSSNNFFTSLDQVKNSVIVVNVLPTFSNQPPRVAFERNSSQFGSRTISVSSSVMIIF